MPSVRLWPTGRLVSRQRRPRTTTCRVHHHWRPRPRYCSSPPYRVRRVPLAPPVFAHTCEAQLSQHSSPFAHSTSANPWCCVRTVSIAIPEVVTVALSIRPTPFACTPVSSYRGFRSSLKGEFGCIEVCTSALFDSSTAHVSLPHPRRNVLYSATSLAAIVDPYVIPRTTTPSTTMIVATCFAPSSSDRPSPSPDIPTTHSGCRTTTYSPTHIARSSVVTLPLAGICTDPKAVDDVSLHRARRMQPLPM